MTAAPWQTLLDDIDRSASGGKSSADLQQAYAYGPNKDNALAHNGALLASPHDPTQKTVVKGVVPNPQTTYAVQTEAARAQRVVKKLAIGPYLPGDQDVIQNTTVPDPRIDYAGERKKVLLKRLTDSIDNTIPRRPVIEATLIFTRSKPSSEAALPSL